MTRLCLAGVDQSPSHSFVLRAGVKAGGKLDFKGYYKLLGLDVEQPAVSEKDIKQAFREGAKRHHPDKLHHLPRHERAKASKKFAELQAAYDILKDPEKRKVYDAGSMPL